MLQININPERTRIISAVTKEEVSKFVKENLKFSKDSLCIQKLVAKNLDKIESAVEKRLSQYDLAIAHHDHFSPSFLENENNVNDLDPLWD